MPAFRSVLALSLVAFSLVPANVAADDGPEAPPAPDVPDRPPDVCFTYNPQALTNFCAEFKPRNVTATTPILTPGAGVCVVGDQCAPGVTVAPRQHTFAMYSVSLEITAMCRTDPQRCRFAN